MAKNEYFADNPRGQTFPELFVTNLVVTKATGHQMKDQENIFPYTLFLVHEFREGMKLMSKRNFSGERKTKD